MPFDVTQDVTVDKSHTQSNFAALDNAISGNLTEINLSSATRIPNSILASPNVEETITLRWGGPAGTATTAASATQPIDDIPLPAANITYTVLRASYTYFTPSAAGAAGSVSINVGTIVAGNFTNATTLVNGVALTANTAANQTVTGNFTLAATTFTAATTPTQIALLSTLAGVSAIRLVVTLVITRSLQ